MAFDPVAYINTPRWQNVHLGLERIELLMSKLGRPQSSLKFIHVAGTNGKGSVCAYLAEILRVAGYKTGLFTSPYIECFEERIRINGENIPADALYEITLRVKAAAAEVEAELGEHPTEFELMCAVAFVYFAREACDIAVVEVGLGGRLDSTNIIVPEVSVIANIGLDHTEILGDTLEEVAAEKAGIIKEGVPVVAYPLSAEALQVIVEKCLEKFSDLAVPDFSHLELGCVDGELLRQFVYEGAKFKTRLLGTYQPRNAVLAIDAARMLASLGWKISEANIFDGVARASWPGRFEIIGTNPPCIIDGAHNPQGVAALRESLLDLLSFSALPAPKRLIFVIGILADKDYSQMLQTMFGGLLQQNFPSFEVIAYSPSNPRALSAETLAGAVEEIATSAVLVESATSPAQAMSLALDSADSDTLIVAFGSLYSIAELKRTYLAALANQPCN